jgi:transcriptional regulator with XRE-family HTH domain
MVEPVPMLAQRVRQLREAKGLSQQALAVAAGLSISVVTQIEQGHREDPRVSTVVAIARALGVSVDALVAPGTVEGEPSPAGEAPRGPGRPRKAAGGEVGSATEPKKRKGKKT